VVKVSSSTFGLSSSCVGYISTLAVQPAHQRRGVGGLLIEKLVDELHRRGQAVRCELNVQTENKLAVDFYTKHSFKIEQIAYGYYNIDDVVSNAYRMLRPLETLQPAGRISVLVGSFLWCGPLSIPTCGRRLLDFAFNLTYWFRKRKQRHSNPLIDVV